MHGRLGRSAPLSLLLLLAAVAAAVVGLPACRAQVRLLRSKWL